MAKYAQRHHAPHSFHGKIVLITGGSKGIGAATAQAFARHGAHVLIVARSGAGLDRQRASIAAMGGTVSTYQADMAEPEQVVKLAQIIIEQHGGVDVLIHNVGGGVFAPLTITPAALIQLVQANLLGAMLLTQALLPLMQARQRGTIIAVAAVSGIVPVDPIYSATKFGLRGFALSLRRHVAKDHIRVAVISPGYVRTEATLATRLPMPSASQVAQQMVRLVFQRRRELVTPAYYRILPWLDRHLPWVVDRLALLVRT